jgi:hypothetical protein
MITEFITLNWKKEVVKQMRVQKARDLAFALLRHEIPYATLIECKTDGTNELVVFEVEVELSQILVNDIRGSERIATIFFRKDDKLPDTLSLRNDFPRVPHINLRDNEFPRSLCLYDQPYTELKRHWTPQKYVEQLRTWLALTAKGKLHQTDQPLEPLLPQAAEYIILPSSLLIENVSAPSQLYISTVPWTENKDTIIASYSPTNNVVKYWPIILTSKPVQHGIMRHTPSTLEDLSHLLMQVDLDLISTLRARLLKDKGDCLEKIHEQHFYNSGLLIIIVLPTLRSQNSQVENNEILAFLSLNKIIDIGIGIDAWTVKDSYVGAILEPSPKMCGKSIHIAMLNPIFTMSREIARLISGYELLKNDYKLVCIGAGALGSQFLLNLARSGFGSWTIIDDDVLLPHNLTRNALFSKMIGFSKARSVACVANSLTDEKDAFHDITANILSPGNKIDELTEALKVSEAIIDLSASVAVARYLSNAQEFNARRISVFLNPTGADLVILAEDANRDCPLDALEMQYYRALIHNNELQGHFDPTKDRQRYGQSCRDVTNRISQESMSLHAAIASRAIRSILSDGNSKISIWRSQTDMSVRHVAVETSRVSTLTSGEWRVRYDSCLTERLKSLRLAKLPRETGGVLIGSLDLEHKIAYIVDTIPSPPDSEEWPTLYIRGCRGLSAKVKEIGKKTDGALQYVGEWHSHPAGSTTSPSTDDKKVFEWLTTEMSRDGLPALMMIVGDDGRFSLFIGTMG